MDQSNVRVRKRLKVTTVNGPPLSAPEDSPSVALVVERTPNPHVSYMHVTGTTVCGGAAKLPRTHEKSEIEVASLALGAYRGTGPTEIPWPTSAFPDAFPWSQAVRRLCFNGQIDKAVNHYFSVHTTTPARTEVVRHLTGSVRSITRGAITTFESPHWTPALCFLVRHALVHGVRLRMPAKISLPVTDACYTALIGHMLQLSYDRIAAFAQKDGGPGWPAKFKQVSQTGTAARQIATEAGLLSTLTSARKSAMWNALRPGNQVYDMKKHKCYSASRDAGADCVQCPVPLHKKQVCSAEHSDTPASIWARHAAAATGTLDAQALVGTVPPCIRSFPHIKWPNDARRFDVTNTVNEVSAMIM